MDKRILYISTTLPSLTLTFVYREIIELVNSGYEISTISMGKPKIDQVSKEALEIYKSTLYLDQVNLITKIASQVITILYRPTEWLSCIVKAIKEKEISNIHDRLRLIYHFLDAGYLFTKLKSANIEHIHAHFLTGPTTIAYFLSNYLNIQFSFTMHASNLFIDPIMLRTKLKGCYKAVTISSYNKKYLTNKYGEKYSKKIKIIHCGIDLNDFKPNRKNNSTKNMILGVGQLVKRKGFRYLVDACYYLKKNNMEFLCVIVGDGPECTVLRNRIKKLELNGYVKLVGRQPQERVKDLLGKAKIFVLPSIITEEGGREGIPVALMEAMAMEIPVISTATVGIPELITHNIEGLLVNQQDSINLAQAIEHLIKNLDKATQMGINGRKKIKTSFDIGKTPALMRDIFNA